VTREISAELLRATMSYDPDTGLLYWKPRTEKSVHERRWNSRQAGKRVGGFDHPDGYLKARVFGHAYRVHRLVWLYVYGSWPSGDIDHIDRVKDNNRISNLRIATLRENNINQKVKATNKSGFKGVSWDTRSRKWQVFIRVGGRNKNLGSFREIADAAEAYRRAADVQHGQFRGALS
jgi:hypothetical protein